MKLLLSKEQDFDFKIFQCVDRALSTIGEGQKGSLLLAFEKEYDFLGRDIAKNPARLEECLKELLGISVSAFVKIHIIENLSESFGLQLGNDVSLEEAVECARAKSQSNAIIIPIAPIQINGGD
jgi:hypothetical protein